MYILTRAELLYTLCYEILLCNNKTKFRPKSLDKPKKTCICGTSKPSLHITQPNLICF